MSGHRLGQREKQGRRWLTVVSVPDPWDPALHRWRSGERCTVPELIDPAEEEKIRRALPPPEPNGLPRGAGYVVVRAAP